MKKKSSELLEKMRKERGYVLPAFQLLAEEDPDFLEAYENLYKEVMLKKGVFPQKVKELFFIIAIVVRKPGDTTALENHIRRALSLGATKEEIVEALECALIPGGAIGVMYAAETLDSVLRSQKPTSSPSS